MRFGPKPWQGLNGPEGCSRIIAPARAEKPLTARPRLRFGPPVAGGRFQAAARRFDRAHSAGDSQEAGTHIEVGPLRDDV